MSIQEDADWAKSFGLVPVIRGTTLLIRGAIAFKAHYNGESLLLGDSIPLLVSYDKIIEDSWSVSICHDYASIFKAPFVFDTTGRIERTATMRHKNLMDMHINQGGEMPGGSLCVAIKHALDTQYNSGFDLGHYVVNFLIPFLFQQSYFELHQEWPWANYSHGEAGANEHRRRLF